jgi:DNA mismatch endonuclease (patch repair protein)
MGYRFRLHRGDLPGTPDIVLPAHRTVIFVHGCFWHRHSKCRKASTPTTRVDFWTEKFLRNVSRDRTNRVLLRSANWRILVVWECQTKDEVRLRGKLHKFLLKSGARKELIRPGGVGSDGKEALRISRDAPEACDALQA